MYNILIIDDNPEILEANISHFSARNFSVSAAGTGIKALTLLNEKQFDCIVLDVLLPDLDGFAICKAIRTITNTPIIFLTCLDDIKDKVKGLAVGGDDYLTKPYSLKELFGRVLALIRRNQMNLEQFNEQVNKDFHIDHDNRMISTKGKNVFLSAKEYDLFMLLYENPQTIFSKEKIISRIWRDAKAEHSTVAVYISKLRRKISFAENYVGFIESNYGEGYRFVPANGKRKNGA